MKIISLIENTPYSPELASEHGLSLYIETQNRKILFDFGQTAAFAENAERLGVDLKAVDTAILSHGHYDHGGGIARFMELNSSAPVYLSRYAFGDYYNASGKYIGLAPELRGSDRLVFTQDYINLGDGLELFSCNKRSRTYGTDSAGLSEKRGDELVPDSFLHEQYLVIGGERKTVISGCSHKGILNISEWLTPDILIGGFHFMKQDVPETGSAVLDKAAERLAAGKTVYYTCHCTGLRQYEYLKEKMGSQLNYLASGQILTQTLS